MCPDCGVAKPLSEYATNRSRPDGRAFYCRLCFNRRSSESYRRRREAAGHVVRSPVEVPEGMKRCPDCEQVLPLEAFSLARRQSGGRASYCRTCKGRRDELRRLQRVYGLDVERLQALRDAQGGACAICRVRPASHIDHDHATGAVRGLLCFRCNTALGQVADRADVLRRAAAYVERHSGQRRLVARGVHRLLPVPAPRDPHALDALLARRR